MKSHSGTKIAPQGGMVDYSVLEGLEAAQIWLSIVRVSITDIAEEYTIMTYEKRL